MLAIALVIAAAAPMPAGAGAARAGMGGVGVGLPDPSGELADNPAAAAAGGVDRNEGLVHAGASAARLVFAGRAYNVDRSTTSFFGSFDGLGWTAVSPILGAGRLGAGVWQVDRHVLQMDEPLDLSLSATPGGPALAALFSDGATRVRQEEALYAAGAVWIQPIAEGDQQVAGGAAYLNQTGRGSLDVTAVAAADGSVTELRKLEGRRSLNGFGLLLGYFYRPVPDGSLGASVFWLGPLGGHVWEQTEGGPLRRAAWTRPAQLRAALGGSFKLTTALTVAVDLKYAGEVRASATLFRGTPEQRAVLEVADPTFEIHAGCEYRLPFRTGDLPLRAGFFNRPDSLPASTSAAGGAAVSDFGLPTFKQDVTGFTLGTGWTRAGLSADVAALLLLVDTRTRLLPRGATNPVDSGDTRLTVGAVGSLTLRFSERTGTD